VNKNDFQHYNGKDEKPAYIAYKGKIYDVSENKHWKNVVHMNNHKAGEDLTDALSAAPHGECDKL
jgi:predicted heme/steroid binding protein